VSDIERPAPQPDADSAPFWAATLEGVLLVQNCLDCERGIYYPRSVCPFCMSENLTWNPASGRAIINTFTIVHKAPPAFAGEVPYVVALVDLPEGVRMLTRIVGCEVGDVHIGMEVEVEFSPLTDVAALPYFHPVT